MTSPSDRIDIQTDRDKSGLHWSTVARWQLHTPPNAPNGNSPTDEPTSAGALQAVAEPNSTQTEAKIDPLLVSQQRQGVVSVLPVAQLSVSKLQLANTNRTTNVAADAAIVDLSDRRVYLYNGKQLLVDYPIAVGRQHWETPTGKFDVIEKQENPVWRHPFTRELVPPGPANPLGTHWIGFWTNGTHQIGFHGTNDTEAIGQAISHGCIRMRNADVQMLYALMPLGATVTVRH
ncbi:MAG: L,D-transpeptidase [Elainellaceae cyanobacterium]